MRDNQMVGEGTYSSAAIWDNRWVRFRMALTQAGVEARTHGYWIAWVRNFMKGIRPKRSGQATKADVERFLQEIQKAGKTSWQVTQARDAVVLYYQSVKPIKWAQNGVEILWVGPKRLESMGAGQVERPPIREVGAGRRDEGVLPTKYRDFGGRDGVGLRV